MSFLKNKKRNQNSRARTVGGFKNIPNTHKSDWDNVVFQYGDQSIDGIKTFTSFPVGPSAAPTTDYQFANKKYVDDQIVAGVTASNGLTEVGTDIQLGGTLASATGLDLATFDLTFTSGGGLLKYFADYSGSYDDRTLVDKEYVDNAVLAENLWDRSAGELSPHNANDDVVPNTTGNLGAGASRWTDLYMNGQFNLDGTTAAANHVFDWADTLQLTTGSIFNFGEIDSKTSGYLFNGSMTTSTIDGSLLLDDFAVSCDHDGLGADTLRVIRRIWSGDMLIGTADIDFAYNEFSLSGTIGTDASVGASIIGNLMTWTATFNDDAIAGYMGYYDMSGITPTKYGTLVNHKFLDDRNTVEIGVQDQMAIRTDGEIDDRGYFSFFEDFKMQTINETDFGIVLHSNGGGSDPAIVEARPFGQIDLVTGGTTDDGSELQCYLPVKNEWGKVVMEGNIRVIYTTDVKVFIGFTNNSATFEHPFDIDSSDVVTATADDACGFVLDTTAATNEWFMAAVNNAIVDTGSAPLGVAPVAGFRKFRIEISTSGFAKFYIEDTLVGELDTTGVDVDIDLFPTVVVSELNNKARTVVVDYIYYGCNRID